MKLVGVCLAIAGWLIPVWSLAFTQSLVVRFALVAIGMVIALVGILGVLNHAHLKKAIWKI